MQGGTSYVEHVERVTKLTDMHNRLQSVAFYYREAKQLINKL